VSSRYTGEMPQPDGPRARFAAVLDLYAFAVSQMRANLRRRHPQLSAAQRERLLAEWLVERRCAPDGDAPGRKLDVPPSPRPLR
jgi:glycine/D-amino acid oxidase-like deaminating enzyme